MTLPIVVAVSEGDEASEAVALGVAIARVLRAPLVLAGVAVTHDPSAAAGPGGLRDYVARALHRRADAVDDDVPCTVHIATAPDVVAGLAAAVEGEQAQMLVVGASHLGPLARDVRGDIGLGAIHRIGCSVLVAPVDDGVRVVAPPRRIGVAWDGREGARAMLELGRALAERTGATLDVVHAPADGAAAALVAASGAVDLLLLGACRRGRPGSPWLGRVSTPVLRHARCPLLVVPEGAWVPTPV